LWRGSGAEHLRGARLVELCFYPTPTDCLQDPGSTQTGNIPSVFRHVKAHPDVALCAEMIDLIRFYVVNQVCQLLPVGQIPIMQEKPCAGLMGILIDMIDPVGIEDTGPTDEAVASKSSAKQEPSWPVIPVINAFFMVSLSPQ